MTHKYVNAILVIAGVLVALLLVIGCQKLPTPAAGDTAEFLAKDPERLQVVMRECRTGYTDATAQQCQAASEAWRRRFFDAKKVPVEKPAAGAAESAARPSYPAVTKPTPAPQPLVRP